MRKDASWVSLLESGRIEPGREELAELAAIFGADLLELLGRPTGNDPTEEAATWALLWRTRADVLWSLALGADLKSEPRGRAVRLKDDILAASAVSPRTQGLISQDKLESARALASHLPLGTRRLILAEVSFMKLDAPLRILGSEALGPKVRALTLLLNDLGLVEDVAQDRASSDLEQVLSSALHFAEKFRGSRPKWVDLVCAGGPVGMAEQALGQRAGERVLLGHDPVGWFGLQMLGGSWLVRRYYDANSPSFESSEQSPGLDEPGDLPLSWSVGAVIAMLLLPSAAPALAIASAMATSDQRRRAHETVSQRIREHIDTSPEETAAERSAVWELCFALGAPWMRIETAKLVAAYAASAKLAKDGDVDTWMPTAEVASRRLAELAEIASRHALTEQADSGTSDHDKNPALKSLVDISETLAEATKALKLLVLKHEAGDW